MTNQFINESQHKHLRPEVNIPQLDRHIITHLFMHFSIQLLFIHYILLSLSHFFFIPILDCDDYSIVIVIVDVVVVIIVKEFIIIEHVLYVFVCSV